MQLTREWLNITASPKESGSRFPGILHLDRTLKKRGVAPKTILLPPLPTCIQFILAHPSPKFNFSWHLTPMPSEFQVSCIPASCYSNSSSPHTMLYPMPKFNFFCPPPPELNFSDIPFPLLFIWPQVQLPSLFNGKGLNTQHIQGLKIFATEILLPQKIGLVGNLYTSIYMYMKCL